MKTNFKKPSIAYLALLIFLLLIPFALNAKNNSSGSKNKLKNKNIIIVTEDKDDDDNDDDFKKSNPTLKKYWKTRNTGCCGQDKWYLFAKIRLDHRHDHRAAAIFAINQYYPGNDKHSYHLFSVKLEQQDKMKGSPTFSLNPMIANGEYTLKIKAILTTKSKSKKNKKRELSLSTRWLHTHGLIYMLLKLLVIHILSNLPGV